MDNQLLIVEHTGRWQFIQNSYGSIKTAMGDRTIDFVRHDHLGCFINDNGMIDEEPLNWVAAIMMYQPLYGPVIFAAPEPDDEGETLPADQSIYAAIINLANIVRSVRKVADQMGQKIDVLAQPDSLPPPMIVGLSESWTFGDPLPTEPPPICIGCEVEATWNGTEYVTEHKQDCALLMHREV